MVRSRLLALALALAIGALLVDEAAAQSGNPVAFNITTTEGPIAELLANFTLAIPPIDVDLDGVSVSLYNVTCTELQIAYLEGVLAPGSNYSDSLAEIFSLSLSAQQLQLVCSGLISAQVSPFLGVDSSLDFTIGDSSALAVSLSLMQGDISELYPNTTNNGTAESFASYWAGAPSLWAEEGSFELPEELDTALHGLLGEGLTTMVYSAAKKKLLGDDSGALPFGRTLLAVEADDSDEEEPQEVRSFGVALNGCDMNVTVTDLSVSNPLLIAFVPTLTTAVENLVPTIVCALLGDLAESVLTPLVQDIASGIFGVLTAISNEDQADIINVVGSFWSFVGAVVLWLILVVFYLLYPTLKKEYYARKKGDDPLGEQSSLVAHSANKGIYDDTAAGHNEYDTVEGVPTVSLTTSLNSVSATEVTVTFEPHSYAMIRHPKLHWIWKYGILLVLLLNIALFATATISIAASVYIFLGIGGVTWKLPSIYSFRLVDSVIEMWEAEVYGLAILIGGLSGIWPYVKLSLMFFAWVLPTEVLTTKWRVRLLRVLDALGKWSLIDAYVLVLFLVSFRVHFAFGEGGGGGLTFDMVVESQYGYFAYLLATMSSLTLTHVFLYLHHELEDPSTPQTEREYLHAHKFSVVDKLAKVTWFGTGTVVAIIGLTFIAVVIGSAVEAFEFSYENSLIGFLIELSGGNAVPEYSVLSMTKAIAEATLTTDPNIGVRIVQITYVFFAFLIPLGLLCVLVFIWLVPMTSKLQRVFYVILEVLSAWASLDVFIVAVIVALVELEQFAIFVVGDKCDGIDAVLTALLPSHIDVVCFNVAASLKGGSWILLITVIVLFTVGYTLVAVCNTAIRERVERELGINSDGGSDSEFDADGVAKSVHPVRKAWNSTVLLIARGLDLAKLIRLSEDSGHYESSYRDEGADF